MHTRAQRMVPLYASPAPASIKLQATFFGAWVDEGGPARPNARSSNNPEERILHFVFEDSLAVHDRGGFPDLG
jgi:hypothetical protein